MDHKLRTNFILISLLCIAKYFAHIIDDLNKPRGILRRTPSLLWLTEVRLC